MMSFGFASSMFDFMTFGAMFYFFSKMRTAVSAEAFEQLFQTGWFVESTLTGLMILLVIRTQRPFFLSRPGRLFLFAEAVVAMVTVLLPYSAICFDPGICHSSANAFGDRCGHHTPLWHRHGGRQTFLLSLRRA